MENNLKEICGECSRIIISYICELNSSDGKLSAKSTKQQYYCFANKLVKQYEIINSNCLLISNKILIADKENDFTEAERLNSILMLYFSYLKQIEDYLGHMEIILKADLPSHSDMLRHTERLLKETESIHNF